jgi:hypothetical protein
MNYLNWFIIINYVDMPGLDINWFRADKGHDPEIIRKSVDRRFRDTKIVDEIIAKDV